MDRLNRSIATRATVRRAALLALVVGSTAIATLMSADLLIDANAGAIEWISLVLFAVNFGWIVTSFWTATLGLYSRIRGGDPAALTLNRPDDLRLQNRHAVIMPIYNEDTDRVFAGLEATWRSVLATLDQASFDLFILSDTNEAEIAAAEAVAVDLLRARVTGMEGRVFYRRRTANTGRKAGNIADFCRSWGDNYATMTVLDADSVMSGETIAALAHLLEQHSDVGIIQTLPIPANRETLFARILQFAGTLYGPLHASGAAFWQLGEANYWGHNACIRLSAFRDHCDLPVLSHRGPFGGEILSHDFVEAALMRGAGWRVWLVPSLAGSFEEVPANMVDFAQRERRWLHGNLQHLRLLTAPTFHPTSRAHLFMGVMSFVASPLWLALLICSSLSVVLQQLRGVVYFPVEYSLFPTWPISKIDDVLALISVTVVVILGPKLMSLALVLANRDLRARFGGAASLLKGAALEFGFSVLLAPCMMLFHSSFILSALLGSTVKWEAQPRDDRGLTFSEAFLRLWPHTAAGLIWTGIIGFYEPTFLWWLSPVLAGMCLAIPFAMITSRRDLGLRLRRASIFTTPQERRPPAELLAMAAYLKEFSAREGKAADFGGKSQGSRIRLVVPRVSHQPLRDGRR